MALRVMLWGKLASAWKLEQLESMVDEATLDQLENKMQRILKGELKRRVLVNLLDS